MPLELEAAARSAGLMDLDLLKLADPTLAPQSAVAALRAKYPAAFPKDARKMSNLEFRDALKALDGESVEAATERRRAFAEAEAGRPDIRTVSRVDFERRKSEFLRAMR